MAKVTIRFKHGMSPYQAGETASFDEAYAARIVKNGYAVYVEAAAEQAIPPAPSKDEDSAAATVPRSFEDYTLSELKEMATKAGIEFDNRIRKAELIELLSSAGADNAAEQKA